MYIWAYIEIIFMNSAKDTDIRGVTYTHNIGVFCLAHEKMHREVKGLKLEIWL